MPLGECLNKHLYNTDKYGDTCPICGLTAKKSKEEEMSQEEIIAALTVPEERYVCGWLVCAEGVNRGRSYQLHSGKNFIGSGDDMDVQILGDDKVNLFRHVIMVFDEKSLKTFILPGESEGLVYIEGDAVYAPQEVAAYSRIDIGHTVLRFVPFCGEHFKWQE